MPTAALCELAGDLRTWLRADMLKMKEKHLELGDPAGHTYLNHASLLDPRFKVAPERFLGSADEVDKCRKDLREHLIRRSEAYPHLPRATGGAQVATVEAEVDPLEENIVTACPGPQKRRRQTAAKAASKKTARASSAAHGAPAHGAGTAVARGSIAAHGTPAHGAGTAAARGPSAAPSTADAPPARQPSHGTLDEILYGGIPSDVAAASTTTMVVKLSKSVKEQTRLYDSLPPLNFEEDPLQWWKSRAWQMPHLAMAARDAFGTPGSSHALERAFHHFLSRECSEIRPVAEQDDHAGLPDRSATGARHCMACGADRQRGPA